MAESFFAVSQQTVILFILVFLGFICTKYGMFSQSTIKELSKFILYTVTPCVIVDSFNRPFDTEMFANLGIAAVAALGTHLINIILAKLLIHDKDRRKKHVYEYSIIFSNCGFMGLPLQQVILGSDGVFYCAVYIAVFNIVTWTYGLFLMTATSGNFRFNISKIILNPGILAVMAGFIFFLTPLYLPPILLMPVKGMAALNTPLPMVIIGYYLSQISSLDAFKNLNTMLTVLARLLFSPLITLGVMYLSGLRDTMLVSVIISASAPVAVNTVMFSVIYGNDSKLGVTLVSITTLLSILTMPFVVALAMCIK